MKKTHFYTCAALLGFACTVNLQAPLYGNAKDFFKDVGNSIVGAATTTGNTLKHIGEDAGRGIVDVAKKTPKALITAANATGNAIGSLGLDAQLNAAAAAVQKLDTESGGLLSLGARIAFPEEAALLETTHQIASGLAQGNKAGLEEALGGALSHYTGVHLDEVKAISKGIQKGDPESIAAGLEMVASSKLGEEFAHNMTPQMRAAVEQAAPAMKLLKHGKEIAEISKAVSAGDYEKASVEALASYIASQHS